MAETFPFRSALVTGASSGIGEAIARQLATAGVTTTVVARREDRLRTWADEFDVIDTLVADLTSDDGLAATGARVRSEAEPIDLVVNNAGFGTSGNLVDLDPDRLADEVALNVGALTRLSHDALSVMIPRRRGWLLNVSSVAGFQPAPRLAVYAATKAYVTSLTESLHGEASGAGVKVSALCPGLTRTEFQQVSNTERYQSNFPDFAWSTAAEVAAAGLDGVVKGRAVVVPGAVNKGIVTASSMTPRWLKRAMSNIVQRG